MGFQIATEQRPHYLRVQACGRSETEDDLARYAGRVATLGSARGCRLVLLDEREATSSLSLSGRLRAVDELALRMREASIERVACVALSGRETAVRLEARARRRGLDLALFTDPAEAEAWLLDEGRP